MRRSRQNAQWADPEIKIWPSRNQSENNMIANAFVPNSGTYPLNPKPWILDPHRYPLTIFMINMDNARAHAMELKRMMGKDPIRMP